MTDLKMIKQYNKDRDKAVASLDFKTFRRFCFKWGIPCPPSDDVAQITMRKMMYHITSFSEEDKQAAKEWLEIRGYTTDI